jgi:hypothetical protein
MMIVSDQYWHPIDIKALVASEAVSGSLVFFYVGSVSGKRPAWVTVFYRRHKLQTKEKVNWIGNSFALRLGLRCMRIYLE